MGNYWVPNLHFSITSLHRIIMTKFKAFSILAAAVLVFSCGGAEPEVSNTPETNTADQSKRVADTVASHSVDKAREKDDEKRAAESDTEGTNKRKWSRSGDPIDTSSFDKSITDAEKSLKSKPEDPALKKKLGNAFFERGVALTAARQYASAIGDFRRTLKYDPENAEAKKQLAMITSIYESMNIESPKEGEEPAPLEFKKEKD